MPDATNIILILTDDQGHWAMGCAGNREIRTPNLDRLAASGMRFEKLFCVSPVCSPARASILTGRIPSAHGIHDWINGGNSKAQTHRIVNGMVTWEYDSDTRPAPAQTIEYLAGLPGYTDILAAQGYTCGLSGKWHMGDADHAQKSFSYWQAHALGGGSYYNYPWVDGAELTHRKGEYVTAYTTDKALAFLDANKANPFCLNVCYTAPHSPWEREHHPAETYDDYFANCPFESVPEEPKHAWATRPFPDTPEKRRADLAGYFAAVTEMDKGVGRILDWLEAHDQRQNTLVIFTSDNGMNMGHHGMYGKGNGTFPLNMYDTSVKVPGIVSMPGWVREGEVNTELVSHYDLFPTILDVCGCNNPEASRLPGRSFAGLLQGQAGDGHHAVVIFDEYGPVRMIRSHTHKYVHRYPYGPHEFYDLTTDPGEKANRIDDPSAADRIQDLKGQLDTWFARHVDPNRDGAREPVTGAGQHDLAGTAGQGRPAFCQGMQFPGGHDDGRRRDLPRHTP